MWINCICSKNSIVWQAQEDISVQNKYHLNIKIRGDAKIFIKSKKLKYTETHSYSHLNQAPTTLIVLC